jgi:phosphoglycolate phosphatase
MVQALIFDKDGTLFDFTRTWGAWVMGVLPVIQPDASRHCDLLQVLGYDPAAGRFAKSSPVIGCTTPEIAALIQPLLPHFSPAALNDVLNEQAKGAPLQPAVDLPATLASLRAQGLRLGLATNDTEGPARAHLTRAGVLTMFDFIAGCDSGWGGKPAPGQLLAFAETIAIAPANIGMVGDSLHDLHAARAAGMLAIGVLTGVAERADLAPHADVVLPNIGHIAGWLAQRAGGLAIR